jgi:hypothetical protein
MESNRKTGLTVGPKQHTHGCRALRLQNSITKQNTTQKNRGFVSLFLILIWLPLILLSLASIKLKTEIYSLIINQRNIDQCLQRTMEFKCKKTDQISRWNEILINLERTATALRPLTILPAAGAAAQKTISTLKRTATLIAKAQDGLLNLDQNFSKLPLYCAKWQKKPPALGSVLERVVSPLNPDFPGTLHWKITHTTIFASISKKSGHFSFGSCLQESKKESGRSQSQLSGRFIQTMGDSR